MWGTGSVAGGACDWRSDDSNGHRYHGPRCRAAHVSRGAAYTAHRFQAAAVQANVADAAPFAGEWTLNLEGPNGPAVFDLVIKTEADKVVGEIKSEQMPPTPITDISKTDKGLVLKYLVRLPGQPGRRGRHADAGGRRQDRRANRLRRRRLRRDRPRGEEREGKGGVACSKAPLPASGEREANPAFSRRRRRTPSVSSGSFRAPRCAWLRPRRGSETRCTGSSC